LLCEGGAEVLFKYRTIWDSSSDPSRMTWKI
jgi:hypothetical protein